MTRPINSSTWVGFSFASKYYTRMEVRQAYDLKVLITVAKSFLVQAVIGGKICISYLIRPIFFLHRCLM